MTNPNTDEMDVESYLSLFAQFGTTDYDYLRRHYPRFCQTRKLFREQNPDANGKRLLDLGAHWLHQSVLYAQDGYKVTAADFPATTELDSVVKLASYFDIELMSYHDISQANQFDQFEENSFDVIVFTELIEHITFNPVDLWKGLYRILSPQGKIIVTTPNYYYYYSRVRDFRRMIHRMGGGIPVMDILSTKTYGHHWKEYSANELTAYFQMLSNDFYVNRLEYTCIINHPYQWLEDLGARLLPVLFRQNIYAEVLLREKTDGILLEPHWG